MKTKTTMSLTERMTYAVLNGPYGRELFDPERYSIAARRTLVDADVDYREWGTRYHVTFRGSAGTFGLGWHETNKQAQAAITDRCAVLIE